MADEHRIDASDPDNVRYYINNREVSKQEYFDIVWAGSMFKPEHLRKDKNLDA